jgi:hypothetical protein
MTSESRLDLIAKLRGMIHDCLKDYLFTDEPAAILDFPDIRNCRDSAIWLGEMAYLRERHCKRPAYYVSRRHDFSPADLERVMVASADLARVFDRDRSPARPYLFAAARAAACRPRQQLRQSAAVHVSLFGRDRPVLQGDVTRRWNRLGAQSGRKRKWRMMRYVIFHRGVCGGVIR